MASARRLLISMCSSGGRWTLVLPGLLLLLLPALVSSFPASSGTNAASLGRRWERLFSVEKSELRWESDYLLGIRRARRLYCNVGIGFHLQVLPDGRISGVHSDNQYSLIEISAVARGVVSLYGVKSEMFVAMNSRGKLYGTRSFRDECKFKETLLPNNYNAYESSIYKGYYVALSKHGRLKRGFKASPAMTVTHFLPRL